MAVKRFFPLTLDDEISREHVDAWVDYSAQTFEENMKDLIVALNQNSRSSSFLAWVGVAIAFVGLVLSGIGVWYTYLSYVKP